MALDWKAYPVLYVDDERGNRVVLEKNLRQTFTVIAVDSGEAALNLLQHQRIAVLLTDQRMPRMTGVDLAEHIQQIDPDVVRIILTAYGDMQETIDAINRGKVYRFLQKPWPDGQLQAALFEGIQIYYNRQLERKLHIQMTEMDRNSVLAFVTTGLIHDLRRPSQTLLHNIDHLDELYLFLRQMSLQSWPSAHVTPHLSHLLTQIQEVQTDIRLDSEKLQRILEAFVKSITPQGINLAVTFDATNSFREALLLTESTILRTARFKPVCPDHPVYLYGSPQQFLQVLNNLLVNAIQALPPDSWKDNLISFVLCEKDDQVEVTVSDNGAGIPDDILPKIFDFFFTTKGDKGCGLGLAICKKVIEAMNGNIQVHSKPKQGTTFCITLPKANTQNVA